MQFVTRNLHTNLSIYKNNFFLFSRNKAIRDSKSVTGRMFTILETSTYIWLYKPLDIRSCIRRTFFFLFSRKNAIRDSKCVTDRMFTTLINIYIHSCIHTSRYTFMYTKNNFFLFSKTMRFVTRNVWVVECLRYSADTHIHAHIVYTSIHTHIV